MGHRPPTATISRTVVVAGYVLALALVGRPIWLAVLLGVSLALIWAAPLVLGRPRYRSVLAAGIPVVEPKKARPS